MSKAEVEHAIITAKKHVAEFQPAPPRGRVQIKAPINNHETSTRYIVIDPILRALGWDLSNPAECVVEYEVARRENYPATRVDYVLKDATGEPAIVIEAKRIDVESDDERALDQMERYLQDIPTATLAVVTNGQYWNIAKRERNGWEAESPFPPESHSFDCTYYVVLGIKCTNTFQEPIITSVIDVKKITACGESGFPASF